MSFSWLAQLAMLLMVQTGSLGTQECFFFKLLAWELWTGTVVEPVAYYQKVTGSISLVCMPKCPWARY